MIAERPVQLGEMAQPGRPLFAMFDPSDLRVLASVPEDVIARVRTGAKGAAAELPALARTVPAKSVTVLPSADARTHSKLVRLDLPDDDATKGAYPGMFARALFATGSARKLLIPQRAVAYRSEVAGAYVVTPAGEIGPGSCGSARRPPTAGSKCSRACAPASTLRSIRSPRCRRSRRRR